MTGRCPSRERLDELALAGDASIAPHVASCQRCSSRVAWIRRETEAVREWAARDDAPVAWLWPGVQARIRAGRRRLRWFIGSGAAVSVAAAAAAFLVMVPPARELEQSASAELAIDDAEIAYRQAAEVLEHQAEAHARTGAQRAALEKARSSLQLAQATASSDAAGRMQVLEGYAAYLRSLRRSMREDL